jgi:hypothetical protein
MQWYTATPPACPLIRANLMTKTIAPVKPRVNNFEPVTLSYRLPTVCLSGKVVL